MSGRAEFVHLHLHSEYSLLDGASRITDLAATAAAEGMPAMAVTDHGAMYGAMEWYRACGEAGVKPLLGCEVYVAPRSRFDKTARVDDEPYHFVLLARDHAGYQNLTRLVTAGFLEGFYYKPRVDREILAAHAEGLIGLSACLGAEVPQLILQERLKEAEEAAAFYRDAFGRENFFLELQDHGLPEQRRVNRELVAMAGRLGLGLVATNDAHYLRQADATAHDALLCIQTAANVDAPKRLKFPNDQFYVKSPDEMAALFAEVPEALANTLAVAERCDVRFEFGTLHLPRYELPSGYDADGYLKKLCLEGFASRYGPEAAAPPEARQRLDYELAMIARMGYSGYFLIVWDFIDYARRNGIPVGPGRGSAAGSVVAYCLGITGLDPLRYGLVFERFLNPERVDMPDIDIDFCYERRDEVIRYVTEKYGSDCVAQIITFGTMGAKAVIRDVGRVLGMSYGEVDRIAKLVPGQLHMTLDRALEVEPELRRACDGEPRVRQIIEIARSLEGLPRHPSVHAAGVVISHEPLVGLVPLARTQDGNVVTQFNMDLLKEIGLLKMDFLGLRTLTVLKDAVESIERSTGAPFDLESVPLDDAATYRLLCEARTSGVFQLESSGMRDLMRELRPTNFEDIIAAVALFRPGPMENIPAFVAAKHGGTPRYPHPDLEPVLRDTYGTMIYQEQILRAASVMAGFSLGEADMLRRAMGKKKKEIMDDFRQRFVEGCEARGHGREVAGEIYDLIEKFAGYGFNKSHAAAYGLLAYQTAYLKANHPVEFMAALLTSVVGASDKVAEYVAESRRLGIEVLPPDVNESGAAFTVVGPRIRFGLAAVKNVGGGAIESVVAARAAGGSFGSLGDFCRRVDLRLCNRRALESLIRAGAFGSLGRPRASLAAGLDGVLSEAQRTQRRRSQGQVSLFDLALAAAGDGASPGSAGADLAADDLPDVPELPHRELLAMEKEVLGLYLSGHPLQALAGRLEGVAVSTRDLRERAEGNRVVTGGIVTAVRRTMTRKGEPMAFITLEDLSGQVDVVVFPSVLESCRALAVADALILVRGKVSWRDEQVTVVADEVGPLVADSGEDGGVPGGTGGGGTGGEDGPLAAGWPAGSAPAAAPSGDPAPGAGPALLAAPAAPGPFPATFPAGPVRTRESVCLTVPGGAREDLERLRGALCHHPGPIPVVLHLETARRYLRLSGDYGVTPGPDLQRAVEGVLGPGAYALRPV